MKELKGLLGNPEIKFDDVEYLYRILTRLVLSKKEKEFLRGYKEVRKLYELLGPSEIKLEYNQFFKFLTAIYSLYIKSRGEEENKEILNRFYRRVVESIYNSTEIQKIEKKIPKLRVDEKYIEEVEKNLKNIESRTFNRLTVIKLVIKDKPRTPIYESISDRVDKLIKSWRERKVEIKKVYKELKRIFKDLIFIDERKRKLGLSDVEYSILTTLEKKFKERKDLAEKTRNLYNEIKPDLFTGWIFKKSIRSKVEKKVKLFLIRLGKTTKKERDELCGEILKTLKEYG
jgi:type I restriction enzyme R subunit